MKVCSFLPAVTQMIYDMNLQNDLYGITFECPPRALLEKEILVYCTLVAKPGEDSKNKVFTSKEIDILYSQSKSSGTTLYYIDEEKFLAIAPELIFTQDTCDVCQIDTQSVVRSVHKLDQSPKIISITPNSLEDVFTSALVVAEAMGAKEKGLQYIQALRDKINFIQKTLEEKQAPLRQICLLEWLEPLFNCGHWIPDQIRLAGGVDTLSKPHKDSHRISWEDLEEYNPDILILAPCGFSIERTLEEIQVLIQKKGWENLRAVKNNSVYIADFAYFTQSSPSTLTQGIALLAALLHPTLFKIEEGLEKRVFHVTR